MITLLNAAPDTGNQGVSALCHSIVAGLTRRGASKLTVADHGRGLRHADWGYAQVDLVGLTHHRRFWRGDNLRTAHALVRHGSHLSAAARVIAGSQAVLDISGGDSFTDLYGAKRFQAMSLSKRMVLDAGVPLILLPQKLGPFSTPATQAIARDILERATAVWVRDEQSYVFLQSALGSAFDPARHRLGVDVAVALPEMAPATLKPEIARLLTHERSYPLAGLNVSGLLFNQGDQAQQDFGLNAPHSTQITAVARALLKADQNLRLVLVPHVHRPDGDAESDLAAAQALQARLGEMGKGRVEVLDDPLNAMELKWVLARLDWFAGARMHATIGAFSSGTPTLGLGYTDKAKGVFAECGIGDEVVDLRTTSASGIAVRAVESFARRKALKHCLSQRISEIKHRATREMDDMAKQAGAGGR
ncbi:colanic acid biosynthesis protein [Falsiruegeria litorea R37]|uniref:Colanic acid biosynthesis protein n=1 Tax=Falsiruegeria litorea R37 TaxID=1200284 RepID=A0A1Y5TT28_9RHOB|nr:polysaccharide pyruvyl transferase family protein [Falsiruegeria litorea]SLN67413.1 colanic acid biosynthesis protein [Falsiruegeria litorea R37]